MKAICHLAQVIGLLLAAAAVGFGGLLWREVHLERDQIRQFHESGLSLQRERLELERKTRADERFLRASEALANPTLAVRLAAIGDLGRLSAEHASARTPVEELLSACIRRWGPLPPDGNLPEDLQATLTALCSTVPPANTSRQHGVDLRNAQIPLADLKRANLSGALLAKANLAGAHLSEARLDGADLTRADLRDAKLRGASLRGAMLRGANLRGADLQGVDLTEADLRPQEEIAGDRAPTREPAKTELHGANLEGAKLKTADLRGTDISSLTGILTWQQLEAAIRDDTTALPAYLQAEVQRRKSQ